MPLMKIQGWSVRLPTVVKAGFAVRMPVNIGTERAVLEWHDVVGYEDSSPYAPILETRTYRIKPGTLRGNIITLSSAVDFDVELDTPDYLWAQQVGWKGFNNETQSRPERRNRRSGKSGQ